MKDTFNRRHSRWYERLIFSELFYLVAGLVVATVPPAFIRWGTASYELIRTSEVHFNTFVACGFAFFGVFLILRRFKNYPGAHTLSYILPSVAISYLLVVAVLFMTREGYARSVLLASFALTNLWCFVGFYLSRRYRTPKLALVPFGRTLDLTAGDEAVLNLLDTPALEGRRYDAVVADLHSDDLPPEWERFLARCVLARIPVYNTRQVQESLSGRVRVNHLSENEFGALLPSPVYDFCKRVMDIALVLLTVPVWLPVMLITGVIIKLESPGPMFFIQERIGQGSRAFKVYKLRSMCKDSEKDGAQFAAANDMRVTRVGRVIRKTRIDELPQFINVLKGEMSLIGPRPEQKTFVERFEKEIPFYTYRHVVKPGITGWAQVVHGYAANADDTRVKIEHDFYYIKHFSLWLDILIIFRTIRTILTGFGAR
ncbi:glycosyl transferase [Marinobacterium zhoushanense]|uniref:Glycosyl transferase n=1 Tax=Marinobacterium zhoushanense TaxID=1679163 RepID=A0ABQ1KTN0_9GAMM|nr:sugar transferase [Marinobacterium zhoushanense]GGC06819.1 glycosyl transferase [Marinobacterium zhoushanense]